jgi:hypothetical protein
MPATRIPVDALITAIQRDAFAALGMDEAAVLAFFEQEKQRVTHYLSDKPDFLRPAADILAEDPSLDYVETDLPERFNRPVPTPLQHPYLYSWLCDCWRYHCEKTYGTPHMLNTELMLATAPTGRFNAMALAGPGRHGILLEDGLLNVVTGLSNLLAIWLYERIDERRYLERDLEGIRHFAKNNPETVENMARIIWQYVVEGYSVQPEAIGTSYRDDFSIRHVISGACWSFIFEHEAFHLKTADGVEPAANREQLEARYRQVWTFFDANLNPVLPVKLDEMTFRQRYLAHQEELFADYFATLAVARLGRNEQTLAPSLSGVLLFFLAAESVEYLVAELADPGSARALRNCDGMTLSLTAIVMDESHPYAFARREGLLSGINMNAPETGAELRTQNEKISFIAGLIRDALDVRLSARQSDLPAPHSKWQFGKTIAEKYLYPH